jgi:hypothetical protein
MEIGTWSAGYEIQDRSFKTRNTVAEHPVRKHVTRNSEALAAASPYDPEKIEIAAQEGTPFVVRLKKRPVLVKDVVNMWRIDEEWWRKPISRLYFSLELENGARITVFRDLVAGAWYRQNWA